MYLSTKVIYGKFGTELDTTYWNALIARISVTETESRVPTSVKLSRANIDKFNPLRIETTTNILQKKLSQFRSTLIVQVAQHQYSSSRFCQNALYSMMGGRIVKSTEDASDPNSISRVPEYKTVGKRTTSRVVRFVSKNICRLCKSNGNECSSKGQETVTSNFLEYPKNS
jgi:hypothetical protein